MTQPHPAGGARSGGPAPALRVATWNILNGTSLLDGRVDAGRLREAAASLRASALGLQEVDRGQPRSGGLDLVAEVAAGTGAAAARFVPALIGTPGGRWRPALDGDAEPGDVPDGRAVSSEPEYGVGLVSAFPVRS